MLEPPVRNTIHQLHFFRSKSKASSGASFGVSQAAEHTRGGSKPLRQRIHDPSSLQPRDPASCDAILCSFLSGALAVLAYRSDWDRAAQNMVYLRMRQQASKCQRVYFETHAFNTISKLYQAGPSSLAPQPSSAAAAPLSQSAGASALACPP